MEDLKKYLAMVDEELEEPNNLSQDWVRLLERVRDGLKAAAEGRCIFLPRPCPEWEAGEDA